jgi:CHAT domain-containing protein/tetratricopeptide (TPR) repeat protein
MSASSIKAEPARGVQTRAELVPLRVRRLKASLAALLIAAALALCKGPPNERIDPRQALSRAQQFQQLGGEKNLHRARKLYLQALTSGSSTLDFDSQVTAWTELGRVESLLGNIDAEVSAFRTALNLVRHFDDSPREAIVLNDLGRALRKAGHLEEAQDAYQAALASARVTRQITEQAAALNNLGMLKYISGDPEAAIHLYDQAFTHWQAGHDEVGAAVTLSNQGEAYVLLGSPEDAIDYFTHALEILERHGRDKSAAATWTMLGWAKFTLGNTEGALQAYRSAISLQEKAGDVPGKAGALDHLGTAYRELRRFGESYEAYQEALQISQESGSSLSTLHIQYNLCELLIDWDRVEAAEQHCAQADGLLSAAKDPNAAAHGWFLAARIAFKRGQFDQAQENVEKALALVDGLWLEPASRSLRASFLAARRYFFDFYLDLLLERHRQAPRAGWDQRAFELSERVRTRGFVDALLNARDRGNDNRGRNPGLIRRKRDLRLQIEALLPQSPSADLADPTLESRLRSLRRQRDALQAQVTASGTSAQLSIGYPVGLQEAQLAVTDSNTALLAYAVGEQSSILWLVTTNGVESHLLAGRKTLANLVGTLQGLLEKPPQPSEEIQTRLALERVSQEILGPVIDRLQSDRLILIPDGPLHFLPFAVLPVPSQGALASQPLVAEHEIVYLPSVSALIATSNPPGQKHGFAKEVLVAADPVFTATDERVRAFPLQAKLPGGSAAGWHGKVGWKRLPGTRREALRIYDLLGPKKATLLLDFDASREAVLRELPSHRIVHLATHGQFNSRFPELSGIVLSLTDAQGSPNAGFLRVQDLYELHLAADLVVLSGCRTARGVEQYSEGLVGFSQALMIAGARQLVANLWDADDDATAELMANFYHGMLRDDLSPAAALRTAQLSLLRTNRWKAPYYWAGFRLQGDWR